MHAGAAARSARATIMLGALLAVPAAVRPGRGQDARPPATHLEALAFDSARGRLVLFGGSRRAGESAWVESGETWEWDDAGGWRLAAGEEAGPGRRRAHAMGYDPDRRVVLLVGGFRDRGAAGGGDEMLRDAWRYDGRRWERDGDAPPLATPQLVYDARRRALLLAGYANDQPGTRWLSLYRRHPEGWRLVDSVGPMTTGPLRLAYDTARGTLVVPALADSVPGVWEWNGREWRHSVAPGPSRRTRYGFAFDHRTSQSVLVGGIGVSPRDLLGDAWSWDGTRWRELVDSGRPGPRASTTLLFDPARARLALYGGLSSGAMVNELWLREEGGWRRWEGR